MSSPAGTVDADVIVAGGGPVGLAAAIEARMHGLTVIVVEPRDGPIDKACGEGLMPGALPLLERLGVDPPGLPLRGVSYRRNGRQADHVFRSGVGRGVRRTTLHSALSERASSLGVERVAGRIESLQQDATGVTAGVGSNGAGGQHPRGEHLRGRHLLGADGLHSTVRGLAGLSRPSPPSRRFGLNRHYAIAPWNDLIEVHWADRAEVYITPVADGLVGVAILGPPRTDFDEVVAGLPELADRLRGLTAVAPTRGAGPLRQRAARPSAGRVLLVGDASGYVDAITGEGLRLGLDQARLAVEHRDGGYDRAWRRATRDFRMLTSGLVRAAASPVRGGIVPLASALPGVYGAVVERLAR